MHDVKFLVQRARNRPFHLGKIPNYPGLKKIQLLAILDDLETERAINETKMAEFNSLSEEIQDMVKNQGVYADAMETLTLIWRKERGVRLALKVIEMKDKKLPL